jgi:Protein of unknown function (DUF3562)
MTVRRARDATSLESAKMIAIESIASETQRSIDEVRGVYDHEFARLQSDARIADYLVLIAGRRTRAVLIGH